MERTYGTVVRDTILKLFQEKENNCLCDKLLQCIVSSGCVYSYFLDRLPNAHMLGCDSTFVQPTANCFSVIL